jgi:hypothetical protein
VNEKLISSEKDKDLEEDMSSDMDDVGLLDLVCDRVLEPDVDRVSVAETVCVSVNVLVIDSENVSVCSFVMEVLSENVNDGVMVGVPETCCDDVTELVGDSLPVSELVSSKLSVMEGDGEGVAESVGDKDLVPDALNSSVSDSVTVLDAVLDGVTEAVGDADASDVGLQKEGDGDTENVGVSETVTVPDRDELSVTERDDVREMSSDWDSVDEGIKEPLGVGLIVRDGDTVSVGVTVLDSNIVLLVLLDIEYDMLLEYDVVSDEVTLDELVKVLLSLLETLNEYDVDVVEEMVVEPLSTVADRSFEPERLHVVENERDMSWVDEGDGEALVETDCDRLCDASVEGLMVGVNVLD